MITLDIKLGNEYNTHLSAKTIDELIDKIKEYHTMSDFERELYAEKGTLQQELDTGWYITQGE